MELAVQIDPGRPDLTNRSTEFRERRARLVEPWVATGFGIDELLHPLGPARPTASSCYHSVAGSRVRARCRVALLVAPHTLRLRFADRRPEYSRFSVA